MADRSTFEYLPAKLPVATRRERMAVTSFGGLTLLHGPAQGSGKIQDMKNLITDESGALAVRAPRGKYMDSLKEGAPHGVAMHGNTLYFVQGTVLYGSSVPGQFLAVGDVEDSDKQFAVFGDKLLVFPDKRYVDGFEGNLRPMEIDTELQTGVVFRENTITLPSGKTWIAHGFRVGDGIRVTATGASGSACAGDCVITSINARTATVSVTYATEVTADARITRPIPDLDHMTVLGNRIYGAKGKDLYISAEGSAFNWYAPLDGGRGPAHLRNDADGDFTACTSWQGYAVFFKEEHICKVQGDRSDSFALSDLSAPGIPSSMKKTLCAVGNALYYHALSGLYRYTGSYPEPIGRLPEDTVTAGVAGTDGLCYYVAVRRKEDGYIDSWRRYVYEPRSMTWYAEDNLRPVATVKRGACLIEQAADGTLWAVRSDGRDTGCSTLEYGKVASDVTFFPVRPANPDPVRPMALYIRLTGSADATMTVYVATSDGRSAVDITSDAWRLFGTIPGGMSDRLLRIPLHCAQADSMAVRIGMTGQWRIHELVWEYECTRTVGR